MPKIAILAIGDELLNGSLSDTNTATIAQLLGAQGFSVRQSRAVVDVIADIALSVQQLSNEHDAIILTGGLGPTGDDLTAEAVAQACDTATELNEEALAMIDVWFERLGRPKHERNQKSAIIPRGAKPVINPRGTAPGFQIELNNCAIYALPGVPDEMAAMIESAVLPALINRFGRSLHEPERVLTLFGVPEPLVEEKIEAVGLPVGVRLAFGVEFPLVLVKLRADGAKAATQLDQAEELVASLYPEAIVARGSETIAATTASLLLAKGKTLSLAESCTGGLIGKMLTDIPGSSGFLERGAITYSNSAKSDWLHVADNILETYGAVSSECAQAMAEGIRQVAKSDFSLAVTGIAGPDGGTQEKPVGTVFIALAKKSGTIVDAHLFAGDRNRVRMRTACAALALLQRSLRQNEPEKND